MARLVVASAQTGGTALVVASMWAMFGVWPAVLLVGILLTMGGLAAERTATRRRR